MNNIIENRKTIVRDDTNNLNVRHIWSPSLFDASGDNSFFGAKVSSFFPKFSSNACTISSDNSLPFIFAAFRIILPASGIFFFAISHRTDSGIILHEHGWSDERVNQIYRTHWAIALPIIKDEQQWRYRNSILEDYPIAKRPCNDPNQGLTNSVKVIHDDSSHFTLPTANHFDRCKSNWWCNIGTKSKSSSLTLATMISICMSRF